MKPINWWRHMNERHSEFGLKLRLGALTVLSLYYENSKKDWEIILLNFGIRSK